MLVDLHIHSIYSDGTFTPRELVKLASVKKMTAIALSDHDTVDGVQEAITLGKENGIEVIPAIELSTYNKNAEIHVLGYYIDYKSPSLINKLKEIYNYRVARAKTMIAKLNKIGIKLEYNDIQRLTKDSYIGRPHVARAMVEAGYIEDMAEAFTDKYIGNDGQAYVEKYKLTPAEAIQLILNNRGLPVLAHPHIINNGNPFPEEDIIKLVKDGLKGIEVYHTKHNQRATEFYYNIAQKLGLLITGGSDFHGDNSPGIEMGDAGIEEIHLDKLRKAGGI